MRILQWALTVPAAVAGLILGLLAGAFVEYLGGITCPTEQTRRGSCYGPWSEAWFEFAIASGSAVAGAAIVIMPALMAPSRRFGVGVVAFAAGVAYATYLLVGTGLWRPYLSALFAGGLSLWVIRKYVPPICGAHVSPPD